jgi:Nif-specific regulatory protein
MPGCDLEISPGFKYNRWGKPETMDYTIGRKIGSGSFGTVREAVDIYGSRCAVKVVPPGDELGSDLLRDEYLVLSAVHHCRVVKALDFDRDPNGGAMLVTELVRGEDLAKHVAGQGTSDLAEITAKTLDGLRCLHATGLVHGDLKPDSILIHPHSGCLDVKLIDAGLDYGKGSRLPTLAGTLPYLAPEVIRNMPGDGRSDLYSLGVVLYEMLTGVCPFGGDSAEEILQKHLEHIPDKPSSVNHNIDGGWDEFVGVLISKEPFHRYRDAVHAGLELQRLIGPPTLFLNNMMLPDSVPLPGRQKSISRLIDLLVPPCGRCVVVCGERGSGVSRTLRQLASRARAQGQRVHMVRLDPGMPALTQVVDAVVGDRSSQSQAASRTVAQGGDTDDYLREVIDAFQSGLSAERKHLLIIEHGEVMGAPEIRLLGVLARELSDLIGVCVGYRMDAGTDREFNLAEACELVELELLSLEDSREVLKYLLGSSTIAMDLAEEVYRSTRGNPGLIDLTLRDLLRSGSVTRVGRGGVIEVEWDRTVTVPTTLRESMRSKLKDLSPAAVDVLRLITAAAGRIERSALSELWQDGRGGPAEDELLGTGLVTETEDGHGIEFKWESLAEVVREITPKDTMAEMSLNLAGIMENKPKLSRDDFRLGVLYLEAAKPDVAFGYLRRSGDYFSRFSPRDAILAYEKALLCTGSEEIEADLSEMIGDLRLAGDDLAGAAAWFERAAATRPSSHRKLAWVLALRGKVSEAIEMLEECRSTASDTGDELEVARILTDLGYVYSMQGRRDLALKSLENACSVFRRHDVPQETARAASRIGIVELRSGDFKAALGAYEAARRAFEKAGNRRRAAACLATIGLCYWKQMDFARAEASFTDALSTLTHLKVLYERASCCQNYALLQLDQGKLSEAQVLAGEALNAYRLVGRASGIVTSTILLGAVALESGNWVEAESRLKDLLNGSLPVGTFHKAMIKRYFAAAHAMRGDVEGSLDAIEESYELACEADDADGQGQALLEKGKIFLRFSRYKDAQGPTRKAMTVLGLSSSLLKANEARRVLGEALCHLGQLRQGMAELMEALDGFNQIPESLHAGRVLRAMAEAYYLEGDHESFVKYLGRAVELFRKANARFDYAQTLLLGGTEATRRANLLQARHYLVEAGRIFESLSVDDLREKAVSEMEKIPSGELEVGAITSLSKISQTLSSSRDLTTVLNLAMDLAIECLGAERGVIMLEDEANGDLTTFVERKMDKESLREVIGISKSIVESVRATKESVIASDATKDPRFRDSKSVRIHNVMSVMCVPLTVGNRFLGIIYVDSRGLPSGFSTLERAFVDAFANQTSLAIMNARFFGRLYDDFVDLRVRAAERYSYDNIIGPGKKMQEVFRQVEKAAKSNITVIVTGECGTGKELIAGLLHELSPRKDKPLVKVNCAAIPRDLLESEMFGIEKRVATGVSPRSGFFERADGGTVFLDEVGDMPPETQMKVLRVLAEQEFERVGGSRVLKVDVRVISATNQDLKKLIEKGQFRNDLYYRLNAMRIHLPPLRDRVEDMEAIVKFFVDKYAAQNDKPRLEVSREVLEMFKAYSWPGNVRELETCIQHAVVFAEGDRIEIRHLRGEILENLRSLEIDALVAPLGASSLPRARRELEFRMILNALKETGWVKTEAADRLGIHESTLRKKIKELGIDQGSDPAANA